MPTAHVAMCQSPRHTLGCGSTVDEPGQRSLYAMLRATLMARVYALQDRMMDFVLKHCLICARAPHRTRTAPHAHRTRTARALHRTARADRRVSPRLADDRPRVRVLLSRR